MSDPEHHDVVVIGAGFSGIGLAIKLREAGIEDFVAARARERPRRHVARQHLPGLRAATSRRTSTRSRSRRTRLDAAFRGQPEIWDYLRGVAERYGVRAAHPLRARGDGGRRGTDGSAGGSRRRAGRSRRGVLVYGGGPLSDP